MIDQFGADGFSVIAFPCNQFRLQEPASNFEIDTYSADPATPPQPYAFMAKMTVNDDPILCTPGGADGSCNRGYPRCDDPNPANCLPTSTRCCMANNAVYDFMTGVLPGALDWNFVSFSALRPFFFLPRQSPRRPCVSDRTPLTGRLLSQLAGEVPDRP